MGKETDKVKIKHGTVVEVRPNKSQREHKFHRAKESKETFAAMVVDVNERSVDLQIYNKGEIIYLGNIPHKSQIDSENDTYWDFIEEEKEDKK